MKKNDCLFDELYTGEIENKNNQYTFYLNGNNINTEEEKEETCRMVKRQKVRRVSWKK